MASFYSLPAIVALAINLSLFIIILLDNPKSYAHRLFALLVFCFALWNIADIIIVNSITPELASLAGAIIVAAMLFASTFILLLSFSFPRSVQSKFDRLSVRPLFLIAPLIFTLLAGMQIVHPLKLHHLIEQNIYCYVVDIFGNPLNVLIYMFLFLYIAWGIHNFVTQLKLSHSRKERTQILYFLYGIIGFGLTVAMLDFLREYEQIHFYGSRLLYLLISVFLSFVILRGRVLIPRTRAKLGFAYSLVTGIMFGIYLIVIKNIAYVIDNKFYIDSFWIEAVLIIVLAFIFRPLVVRVQTLIEHLFYQDIFRYRRNFIRFTREALHYTNAREMTEAAIRFLRETIFVSISDVLLKDNSESIFRSVINSGITLPRDGCLSTIISKESKPCEVEEIMETCSTDERTILQEYRGGYVVGLYTEKAMSGLLLIGPMTTRKPYSIDEVEFFTIFANEISMSIERNVLIEKMRDEQAKAAQFERLASLGRLTAGIAHDFRNPLGIISISAQTILRNPKDEQIHQKMSAFIVDESKRLNKTIDSFLHFAKPHKPTWEEANLEKIIDGIVQTINTQASESNVTINKELFGEIPKLTTSVQHLSRVLTNLGVNAIEAMPKGGELNFKVMNEDNFITITVSDTGTGIPEELKSKIFDPFFTTKSNGTGLGLSIVHSMVESIKGEISLTSNKNGTTFYIKLPIDGSRI
ncbi:MAG: GHKL domain-containing protein [Ignavibacteriales bacterium]|nr:GHKL domain-containing protein [Ignavibacteriales bacterium]